MRRLKLCLLVLVILGVGVAALALPAGAGAEGVVTVAIVAPAYVPPETDFVARVSISNVTDLNSYQFDVSYDPAVIQVVGTEGGSEGIVAGNISGTALPLDAWGYIPATTPGRVRILGHIPGARCASGSGHAVDIHFHVAGALGTRSVLSFSNGMMYGCQVDQDRMPITIAPIDWENGAINVGSPPPSPTRTASPEETPPTTTATPTTTPTPTLTATPGGTATPPATQTPQATAGPTPVATITPAGTGAPTRTPVATLPTTPGSTASPVGSATPSPTSTPAPAAGGLSSWAIVLIVIVVLAVGFAVYVLMRRRR